MLSEKAKSWNAYYLHRLLKADLNCRGISSLYLLAKLNFFDSLSKQALRGLTIAASTVAVVELLKHDYSVGISAAISWLLLIISS